MGQGAFLFVSPGGGGAGGILFYVFHLTPKTVESIIDVTDAEFAIPGGW